MSTLLIDLGNTALKWASMEAPDQPQTYVHHGMEWLPDSLIQTWLSLSPKRVIGCMVSSEKLAMSLTNFFNQHAIQWQWLKSEKLFNGKFKLCNSYENYHQLGSDRWHAAIGAISLYPDEALIIAQMGTATTVDCVIPFRDGYKYIGGRILAGPSMMLTALTQNTSCRPGQMGCLSDFPKNTADAIFTGVVEAHLGVFNKAYESMQKQGFEPKIVFAGGAAPLLAPYIKQEYPQAVLKHNLVLHGLAQCANFK